MLRTEYDDGTKSPLQRAFELAQTGEFAMASDIKKALAAGAMTWPNSPAEPLTCN